MIRLFKAVTLMAAAWFFLIRPVAGTCSVHSEAITIAAIAGAMVVVAIVAPFIVSK